ncbi:GTPase activator protein, partial [Trichomonas vaginalis G3]|uniref:GTPase activator protein n=1 Tax=Trichomonas vaginalis (strain ATCC PRA-98 / G3) TaxID=412133 RepID=UPI0021E60AA9
MDMNGKADPFCVLSVNGEGEQYKTNVVMRSLTPVWNQPFNIPVPNQDKDKLHVIVYDWDEKNSDDVIGYNKIKLHEIRINHPVETLVHLKKRHGVRTERGDVHLRFEAYKPGTEPAIDFVPTAHPEKKVSQEAPTVVDCTVVNATELAMMDLNGKADPYVIVKINENGKINTTKVVKKDRNPVWNETFNMDVADEKKDVLIVECYDWDESGKHDLIGNGEVALAGLSHDTVIERDVELSKEGGLRKKRGTVHLKLHLHKNDANDSDSEDHEAREHPAAAAFLELSSSSDVGEAQTRSIPTVASEHTSSDDDNKDNSAPTEKKADPVVIHCTVVDAQGLPAMDLNGKADPFCALNVNGKGEPQKTQVVMKDKNPVWNQDFNIPVENPEKDKLYITVYDFDEGNDNDVIGFNRLPINDIKVGDAPVERTVELKKRHGIRPDRGVVHLKLSAFNPGEEPGAAPAAEHPVKSEVPPKAEFLDCTVVSASNLVKMDKHGLSDPYVVLKVNKDGEPQKTEVVKQNL